MCDIYWGERLGLYIYSPSLHKERPRTGKLGELYACTSVSVTCQTISFELMDVFVSFRLDSTLFVVPSLI